MPFALLYEKLPDVARAETRCMLVSLPNGESGPGLAFMEMFCDEPGCDCRRVVLQVRPTDDPQEVLAHVSFGWEPDSFYREWARFPLEDGDLEELRGPGLMRMTMQSPRAGEVLELARELLRDQEYRARIVRHYEMFRAVVDAPSKQPKGPPSGWRSPSRKRRGKR